jgi:hypothetical protein
MMMMSADAEGDKYDDGGKDSDDGDAYGGDDDD